MLLKRAGVGASGYLVTVVVSLSSLVWSEAKYLPGEPYDVDGPCSHDVDGLCNLPGTVRRPRASAVRPHILPQLYYSLGGERREQVSVV